MIVFYAPLSFSGRGQAPRMMTNTIRRMASTKLTPSAIAAMPRHPERADTHQVPALDVVTGFVSATSTPIAATDASTSPTRPTN